MSTNVRNTSEPTQPVLRNQALPELTNGEWNSALYVDRILFSLEPTGTPQEERSRYPAGSYSVSRQTVDEHGQYSPRALYVIPRAANTAQFLALV